MTISISSPAAGSSVSGTVNVVGTSSQTISGGAGSTPQSLAGQAFSIPYNTTTLANGAQSLSAGNGVASGSVSVTVNNVVTSADGTTIPSATQIVDTAHSIWTTASGFVYVNGVKDPVSTNVTLLLWFGGVIYQKATGGNWWKKVGSSWVATTDPRPASPTLIVTAPASGFSSLSPVSVSGTTNQTGSVTVKQGSTVLATLAITSGAFSGAVAVPVGAATLNFTAGAATAVNVSGTVLTPSSSPIPFYGINGHPDYTWDAATWVSHCHQIGAKTIRLDTWGADTTKVPLIAALQTAITAIDSSIKILACITLEPNYAQTESQNYTAAKTAATYVATTLGAAGITVFECGNEMTADSAIYINPAAAGDKITDYNGGAPWRAMRGCIQGMIDGVKAANSSYLTAVNFTVAMIAASDMLWNGTEPDGSTGHAPMLWDITSWHNYEVYGDLFSIGTESHGSTFNLIAYISAAYGKPIMITEWNSNPEDSDTVGAAFMTNWMTEMYSNRTTYNIQNVSFYQADGAVADFGLFFFPLKTAAYTNFVAAHP